MSNGGKVGSRGFIFQTIIAIIECIRRNDWDEIKIEPPTDYDKVDIELYQDDEILSAIQVKSSVNQFERWKVEDWLTLTTNDAANAREVHLYLVGDNYSGACSKLINEEPKIEIFPFDKLQQYCIGELALYIKRKYMGGGVTVDDLDLIYSNLFTKLMMNGIASRRISRAELESVFESAIPAHLLSEIVKEIFSEHLLKNETQYSHRLTSIPFIDPEVGLIGRDSILRDVRRMLEEDLCMVLVSGLGGIGKTAVMQQVCNDLMNEENFVAWINCGDCLRDDLLVLRDGLGIPDTKNVEAAYNQIIAKIGKPPFERKLYIFLDDLSREFTNNERSVLRGLGIHVMITSRKENLHLPKLKLTELVEQYAVDMFYKYYGGDRKRQYQNAAKEIVNKVHRHTLLVELLAKAAWKAGGTLEEFREELAKRGVFDVFEGRISTGEYDENLTIEECVKRLYMMSHVSEEQQHIMRLFTIFSPEKPIYDKVCEWAGFDINEISGLVELGWLEKVEGGYIIHQIVRDALKRQVGKVKLEDYGEFLDRVIDTDSYLGSMVTYDKAREIIILTEDVARFIEDSGREDANVGELFNNMANVYSAQGNYDKALEYHRKAFDIHERVLGIGHPNTIRIIINLAGDYVYLGDYVEARNYYMKALVIGKIELGDKHLFMADTYMGLALVYENQDNTKNALEYYRKALAIKEQRLGTMNPDTAKVYNNMANVYDEQGDYEKALEYHRKAFVIFERVLGTKHPHTAMTYNNMANVYHAQGDYDKALEYLRKGLVIRERILGTEHPDTATTYDNMAEVFEAQGYYEKALDYYQRALKVYLTIFGEDHPYTNSTRKNLTDLKEKMKQ